jgi:hypothetical protein
MPNSQSEFVPAQIQFTVELGAIFQVHWACRSGDVALSAMHCVRSALHEFGG